MATLWCDSYFSFSPRRIAIVSSTVGSPTNTGWKRRSRAASFSMCLRYSSSVVAPMQRSSPRASIGLSMFAASTAPSVAPAPTIVCSSSMNRTSSPSAFLISVSTAFSRSSNSPRYFEPARFFDRLVEDARERRADLRLLRSALGRRLRAQRGLGLGAQRVRVGNELARQLLVEQRDEQVLRIELGIAHPPRELLRRGDGFLRFQRQLVEIQRFSLVLSCRNRLRLLVEH